MLQVARLPSILWWRPVMMGYIWIEGQNKTKFLVINSLRYFPISFKTPIASTTGQLKVFDNENIG